MGILIPLVIIVFACLVIWRACDGFEVASRYLGRNLSEGVRGGTINAISSSIPELFTTLIALFVMADEDGFSVGLGTTAGSALFNGMIIPAVCIFAVVGSVVLGRRVDSVNVSSKVILRDGLTLIFCELVLIVLINGNALHWWQGLLLIALYVAYISYMIISMKASAGDQEDDNSAEDEDADDEPTEIFSMLLYWLSGGPLTDLERAFVSTNVREKIKSETWNAWPLLLASTTLIGAACWLLVKACEWLGTGNVTHPSYTLFGSEFVGIGMPPIFVAVIFASMATSVPDTVMSVRDARSGDYDDAVANALGSNVFDICFALGFPLTLYTLINGPIEMDPIVVQQSGEIRSLLLLLTVVGFFVYFLGKRQVSSDASGLTGDVRIEMGRTKAFLLIVIYVAFVFYIVARSRDAVWANEVSAQLQQWLSLLPVIG